MSMLHINTCLNATFNFTDMIFDINLNARYMQTGPGSFGCRDPNCQIGNLMTQSATVQYGPQPHQIIHQQKRYTCGMTDCVYHIH